MSMEWELIESDDALHAMLDGVADCTVVAIDTEFMRRNTFYPQVALVQLCFGDKAWLVSSNPFDVIGAVSAGMRAAWVQRSNMAIFDPWDIEPTAIIHGLDQLQDVLNAT